jgi:FdhD protein
MESKASYDPYGKTEAHPIGATRRLNLDRFHQGFAEASTDCVAVEEPLEIRLDYQTRGNCESREQKSISITMRTPGQDYDLALGFLFSEGLIQSIQQVENISHCGPALPHLGHSNVVKVRLSNEASIDLVRLQRHFYTSSSCGVCGKSSMDALKSQSVFPKSQVDVRIDVSILESLPLKLRRAQAVFESTGGLHAAALFDRDGTLKALCEDVGRHNALDKLIGQALPQAPLRDSILMLSGRISFELVQKAAMVRVPIVAAVGAPSSLAVELATHEDITLIGFLRGQRFNLYTGAQRITSGAPL